MPRHLTNVSGQPLSLQDIHGRWHVVPADGVFVVDDADQRYWQTGSAGEAAIWAERKAKATKTKTTTTTDEKKETA